MCRLRAGVCLLRPRFHFLKARLLYIGIEDCACRAGFGTGRIAAAQITFDDLAAGGVVIHRTERASDCADFATDTEIVAHDLYTHAVSADGVDGTCLLTPGFIALGAGIRYEACILMKIEYPDARSRRVEHAFIFIGTSQLALFASSAFAGVDNQCFVHFHPLWFTAHEAQGSGSMADRTSCFARASS